MLPWSQRQTARQSSEKTVVEGIREPMPLLIVEIKMENIHSRVRKYKEKEEEKGEYV